MKKEKSRYVMPGFFSFYDSCGQQLHSGDWAVSQDTVGICNNLANPYLVQSTNQTDANGQPLVLSAVSPKSWRIEEIQEHLAKVTADIIAQILVPPSLAVVLCLSEIITVPNFFNRQELKGYIKIPEVTIDGKIYTIIVEEGDHFKYQFIDHNGNVINA